MSVYFTVDFSHINAKAMKLLIYQRLFDTMPWQTLDLNILENVDIDIDLHKRAEQKFDTLKINQTNIFDVIDVLALAIIENDEWQNKTAVEAVAINWWLSVLSIPSQQPLQATLVLVLQYHRAPDLYQKFANAVMLQALITTLSKINRNLWQDENLYCLVTAILSNKPNNFATLALESHLTVKQLLDRYLLPVTTEFQSQARKQWLTLYLKLTENQLAAQKNTINSYLNQKTDAKFAVNRAELIFDNAYFKKDLSALEKQTHKFIDIHKWLKEWSKTPDFMQLLSKNYRQILRCWLGAGNYYQLEKAVRYIANVNDENVSENKSRSLNRYIFWTNYQQYIVDYWLLIPVAQQSSYQHIFAEANIKLVKGSTTFNYQDKMITKNVSSVPTVLLRFDNHYFIQPLVSSGGKADLVMTTSVIQLDNALKSSEFDSSVLNTIEPCLIHDHMFLWQRDMALCLKENFEITMGNPNMFVSTPSFVDSFLKPRRQMDHKDRLLKIEGWYRGSPQKTDLDKYAISYQKRHLRHG